MPCKIHGPACRGHATRAKEERPVLEAAQVRALADACANSIERAALLVVYDAALRSKELSMLRREDIDFGAGTALVRRASKGRTRKGAKKEPRLVRIPITPTTLALLEPLPDGPLFPKARWGPRLFQRWFRALCDRASIPSDRRYSHVLRASRATHLFEAGADVKEIQNQLGHWSEATTWIYIHMTEARRRLAVRRASQIMEDVLNIRPPGASEDR